METLPNSRKLNGISLVECLQQDMTDKENEKFNSIVKATYNKRNENAPYDNTKRHPVSKSFRSFFKKLRGTTVAVDQQAEYANHNNKYKNESLSLSAPRIEKKIIVNPTSSTSSLSSYSKQNPSHMRSKQRQQQDILPKQHQLPISEKGRRSKNRHTLDFSIKWFEEESGVTHNHVLRRANSLCNSSIYSTFTSAQQPSKEELSIFTTSSSSSSSSSRTSSCIQQQPTIMMKTDNVLESKTSENKQGVDSSNFFHSIAEDKEEETCHQLQERLRQEDPTLCPKEEIAEYLGQNSQGRSRILYLYMNNFDFANRRLDVAFRSLCAKLYLKAESQQLDRIVEAFAKRYYVCNPTTLLHCFDVVYAVAYALLLLNTDLHLASDWSNRMTKSSFIKNTMETVQSLVFPYLHRKRCASLASTESSPYNVKRNDSSASTIVSFEDTPIASSCNSSQISVHGNGALMQKLDALRSNISWKSTNTQQQQQPYQDGLTRMQKTWLTDVENLLKEIYASVKAQRIDQAEIVSISDPDLLMPTTHSLQRSRTLPKNTTLEASMSAHRRNRGHSVILSIAPPQEDIFTKQIKKNELFKQGLVMRKHMMESTDKRARHRQWQLCYLVMTATELIMYKPVQPSISAETTAKQRRKSLHIWPPPSLHNNACNDWQADFSEAPLATITMNHTYASELPPPGWSSQHPHVCRLHTAEGGLWLFELVDMFAVQAWVEACNITAARISKGSLQGAVCNIDYGWGSQWDNATKVFEDVPVWYAPTPCMVKSTLDIEDQYLDIERQILQLNQQLNEHRDLKWSVDKEFVNSRQGCINSTQALTNWDKKLRYILMELIKLRCYKDVLEKHQAFQF